MEKSNIIISIIIVICIAAGVTAYGLTSEDNGVFKTLQGIGSQDTGSGVGNSTNVSTNNNSGSSSSSGSSDSSGSGYSDNGGSGSGSGYYDNGGSDYYDGSSDYVDSGSSDSSSGDPTAVSYQLTTANDYGGYTVTYYNYLDQAIGYIAYDADGNQVEGAGGAPTY
jgi:hypothetical protein